MISARTWQLLDMLADGQFHSGEQLAHALNLSRASICNALAEVDQIGVALHKIRGRGYRLARPWQQLSAANVQQHLADPFFHIDVLPEASSSNTLLLQRTALNIPTGSVLAVELQTAGRGRQGRVWLSGLGNALTFSLLWRFTGGLNTLAGLSLVVGLAIIRALRQLNISACKLKWPNDIVTTRGKLGGVLIEAQGDMLGPCAVVIGIGLNCFLPVALGNKITQPACALSDISPVIPERNLLLATVLQNLRPALQQFATQGFAPFQAEWQQYHQHQDAPITLNLPDGTVRQGICRGVDTLGALGLETVQGLSYLHSGEIAL